MEEKTLLRKTTNILIDANFQVRKHEQHESTQMKDRRGEKSV